MRPRRPRNMPSRSNELEERVRVLEQIVTDGGAQTAAQIEALRDAEAALACPEGVRARNELKLAPPTLTSCNNRRVRNRVRSSGATGSGF